MTTVLEESAGGNINRANRGARRCLVKVAHGKHLESKLGLALQEDLMLVLLR